MIASETILRMREYGESVIESIRENDPRISGTVQLTFTDGSKSSFRAGFAHMAGDWLFVFTTHDGYFLFKKGDVLNWTSRSTQMATALSHQPVARGAELQAA